MELISPIPSLIQGTGVGYPDAVKDLTLPRGSPMLGFMRHAPQQPGSGSPSQASMYGRFDQLRSWRSRQEEAGCSDLEVGAADSKDVQTRQLPRGSPYVGFQRHAPPSPFLNFSANRDKFCLPSPAIEEDYENCLDDFVLDDREPVACAELEGQLPDEAWLLILSLVADVSRIGSLSRVARGFPTLLQSEMVWANRPVRIPPAVIAGLAPQLSTWLPAWRLVSKLIIPRSVQLKAELKKQMPDLPVEVAWRFDYQLKGEGVEVVNHGRSVRRLPGAEEELVVLGDAPLSQTVGCVEGEPYLLLPYLEVTLDDRSASECGDGLNDFGIGITARPPSAEDITNLAVADEVPLSWVVDFTKSFIVLSVNNREAAKGLSVKGDDLNEGDRVGLRVTAAGTLEVYINGKQRDHLTPDASECVPRGVELFPVLDLYGCTAQLSRTDAERPY